MQFDDWRETKSHQISIAYHSSIQIVSLLRINRFCFFLIFQSETSETSARVRLFAFDDSWTFVNYYVFIAIQFDSNIYGFITSFSFRSIDNPNQYFFFILSSFSSFLLALTFHSFCFNLKFQTFFELNFFSILVWNCFHNFFVIIHH